MLESTVTPGFTRAIVSMLPMVGIKISDDLELAIAGIPAGERLPMSLQDKLWQQVEQQSDNPAIGLQIGNLLQPSHFDVMFFLVLSSPDLASAAQALATYSDIIGEGGSFVIERSAMGWRLLYQPTFLAAQKIRIEAILVCVINGVKWLMGESLVPLSLSFSHPQLAELSEYQQLFAQCNVHFEQQDSYIEFSNEDWQRKLNAANPQIQQQMQTLAQHQLSNLRQGAISRQIRTLLLQQPKLQRAQVAAKLSISARHLNRKLSEEGLSFKDLSEQAKKRCAIELVQQNKLTQAGLAEHLGYADESAFAKAFRRWTGMGIREFRRQ